MVGYFFNPNIHPYQEYQKRLETLRFYSEKAGLEVTYRDEYLLEEFLKNVALRPEERCRYCYSVRLKATAREAKRSRFDGFSTTLLYSIYQKHPLIKETGEQSPEKSAVPFTMKIFDRDGRRAWRSRRRWGFTGSSTADVSTVKRNDTH